MRNRLHVNNGACYLVDSQGPRIPVVKRVKQEIPKVAPIVAPEADKEIEVPTSAAMSLEELSSMFSNMRKSRKTAANASSTTAVFEKSEPIAYTSSELMLAVPLVHTLQTPTYPVTRRELTQTLYRLSGITIPDSAVSVEGAEHITAAGEYHYTIDVPGESSKVRRTIVVHDQ